jgi:hypothetical protein
MGRAHLGSAYLPWSTSRPLLLSPLRASDETTVDRASDVVIERVFVHAPDRFVVVNGFKILLLPVAPSSDFVGRQ